MILGTIFILTGILILIFREKLIVLLGPSREGDFPINVRKRKLIIGGIGAIIFGFIIIIKDNFI